MFRIGTNTLQFLILFSKLTTDHGHLGDEGGDQVTDEMGRVQLGHPIRDFKLEYYDPVANDFGETSLEELKKDGKWTILFFYPADFTFV
jgi:peroxiredoxin (alkyl hydroperoxide reductase subunit C)